MSATPLIKKLNNVGGTMFIFPSANNQLNSVINSTKNKFTFSNFALLNLPHIKTPSNNENAIQFATIDGQILDATDLNDNSLSLVESFQNYCLNLETCILNQDDYQTSLNTVSERVFFKWLKELGAMRFQYPNEYEADTELFVEEKSQYYKRVVEYLGDIQVTNNNMIGGDNYREIYVNIPTTHSSTPTILFNSYQDNNYHPSKVITGDNEYIKGRGFNTTHPHNLSLHAFYDVDDIINYSGSNEDWWGSNVTENSYYTEPSYFNDPSNTLVNKKLSDYGKTGEVSYLRSNLDGIRIEWNDNLYKELEAKSLSSIQELNENSPHNKFEFNTILIYYTYENDLGESVRNLYGVLFLDDLKHDLIDGSYINKFTKTKFNKILKTNGNSFGLKLHFKLGTNNINDIHIENVINDYETYSLSLFTDALSELKKLAKNNGSINEQFLKLYSKYDSLQENYATKQDFNLLKDEFNKLYKQYQNANLVVSDMQSILDKLENLSKIVSTILNNQTPLNVSLDYSPLVNGDGIEFVSLGNKLKINQNIQEYNKVTNLNLEEGLYEYEVSLSRFTNLLIVENNIPNINDNITIKINDFPVTWKNNQTLKIVFRNDIKMNTYAFNIVTDSQNSLLNVNSYMKYMYVTTNDILKSTLEFICIDKFNKEFITI